MSGRTLKGDDRRGRHQKTVLLIDKQRSFAEALLEALRHSTDLNPVLMDTSSDGGARPHADLFVVGHHVARGVCGVELLEHAQHLRDSNSADATPAVILTAYPTPWLIREAEQLERVSVISKHLPLDRILSGLRRAIEEEIFIMGACHDPFGLTESELFVLEQIALGSSATSIAQLGGYSTHTIRGHIKSLLRKTECANQVQALAEAMRAGIIAPQL